MAQETTFTAEEAKAFYTIEVAKQITWPNEDNLKQIVVGIIGKDKALIKAFEQYESLIVRGKTFKFENVSGTDFPPERFSMIFITEKSHFLNSSIFSSIKNAIIITDGKISKQKQMISFYITRSQLKIELNRYNLSKRGFVISTKLLSFAGTKKDITDQLRDKESYLKILLAEEELKQKDIEYLNKVLTAKNVRLESAQKELEHNSLELIENRLQLATLINELKTSQALINNNSDDIAKQVALLTQKQIEISSQEKAMEVVQRSIQINKTILAGQLTQIEKQHSVIEIKDETIESQRGWLILILLVSSSFFVMIYFLLKSNNLRRKANSKLSKVNRQLFELAITDGMTGLFNRRHFLETAQQELLRQKRSKLKSALLMIDIDYFKLVNDNHGHAVGDLVIKSIANILKKNIRNYDIVGRLGGEEFALMLIDCDLSLSVEIAERLCNQIRENPDLEKRLRSKITVSIGVSLLNADDTEIEQAIIRADEALYMAKDSGRDQVAIFQR
jgi:diguanylate cyclase (GGDEF)-like protein